MTKLQTMCLLAAMAFACGGGFMYGWRRAIIVFSIFATGFVAGIILKHLD